jgi:hypothetical protein
MGGFGLVTRAHRRHYRTVVLLQNGVVKATRTRAGTMAYVFRAVLVLATSSITAACLPGDPGGLLLIANECDDDIWVTAQIGSPVAGEIMPKSYRVSPGSKTGFSVLNRGPGSATFSVSGVQNEADRLFTVPNSGKKSETAQLMSAEICALESPRRVTSLSAAAAERSAEA